MKFNIWFTIKGPSGRTEEVPNNTNPVKCANLASLLVRLSENLPRPFGIAETVGVRVEQIEKE